MEDNLKLDFGAQSPRWSALANPREPWSSQDCPVCVTIGVVQANLTLVHSLNQRLLSLTWMSSQSWRGRC